MVNRNFWQVLDVSAIMGQSDSQMVVAMCNHIKSTSIGTDHCNNSQISINCITNTGKASMMLHTFIQAGHDTIPVNQY